MNKPKGVSPKPIPARDLPAYSPAASVRCSAAGVCVGLALAGMAHAAPMSVDDLVEAVVARNPSVLAALSEGRAAEADVQAAQWQRYPVPSVQTELSQRGGKPSTSLALTQPLWMISGPISAQIESAESSARGKVERVAEVRYQAAERTVDTWRALVSSLARRDIGARALQRLQGLQSMMRRRVDAQVSPNVELDLVNSRVSQTRVDVLGAQAAVRQNMARLEQLVGSSLSAGALGHEVFLQDAGNAQPGDPVAGAGVTPESFDDAIARHPTVRRSEQEARTVQAQIKAKEAERWPQVYVKLQHTSNASTVGAPKGVTAFVGLQYTPGAGLSLKSQTDALVARAQGAQEAIEAQRRELRTAFEADWSDFSSSQQRYYLLSSSGRDARAVVESYERLFTAGRRSWQDLLTAVREQQQTEEAIADARITIEAARHRLALRAGQKAWQTPQASSGLSSGG